ncbi:hypothetical protein AAG570_003127 [Ranatra chinensis]|uniref:Uncharacterized protein n=1 Tax=Ranatra chinensis TaxID=642074 RepID=A0ABD0Y5X5_9HEMI
MTGDEADGDEAELEEDGEEYDAKSEGQHFFPSFAPLFSGTPLNHNRPRLFEDQPRGFTDNYSVHRSLYPSEETERVLGSGNFGVLRGGTYYASQDDEEETEPYYRGNNGHGRPPYYRANPQPAYRHGGDFFAGFRDFADITTPPKSAYSEYYVVYANKNSTGPTAPEQLALLDAATSSEEKTSKTKQKLASHKEKTEAVENKKKKNKLPKDLYEPLLALS